MMPPKVAEFPVNILDVSPLSVLVCVCVWGGGLLNVCVGVCVREKPFF